MKITERGQVTIPQELRERYGFLPNTEVDFIVREDGLQIVRRTNERRRSVEEIYGTRRLPGSTDELMQLLRG